MDSVGRNVAETIPVKSHKHKFYITQREFKKGRYVEVWDNVVYSARRFRDERR